MIRKRGSSPDKETKAYKVRETLKKIFAIKEIIEERERSNSITSKEIADMLGFKCKSTYEESTNIFSIEFTEGGLSKSCLKLLISGKKKYTETKKEKSIKIGENTQYVPINYRIFYFDVPPTEKDFNILTKKIVEDIKLEILGHLSEELDIRFNFNKDKDLTEMLPCFSEFMKKFPGLKDTYNYLDSLDEFKKFFIKKPKSFGQLSMKKCSALLYFKHFYDAFEKKASVVKELENLFNFPRIEGDGYPKTNNNQNSTNSEEDRLRNDIDKNSTFMQWLLAISNIKTPFINKSYSLSVYNSYSYWIDRSLIFKKQKEVLNELDRIKKQLRTEYENNVIKDSPSLKYGRWHIKTTDYADLLENNSELIANGICLVSHLDYLCTKIFLIKHLVDKSIMNKDDIKESNRYLNEQELLYWSIIALNNTIFPYLKKYIIEEVIPKSAYKNNLPALYKKLLKEEPLIKEFKYFSENPSFFMADKKNKTLQQFFQIHKKIYKIIYDDNEPVFLRFEEKYPEIVAKKETP